MASEQEIAKIIMLTRKIETLLGNKFHAQGKGLHEKISSVENILSEDLVKSLRFLATIRNKAMHEDGFRIDNFKRYEQTAEASIKTLETFKIPRQSHTARPQQTAEASIKTLETFKIPRQSHTARPQQRQRSQRQRKKKSSFLSSAFWIFAFVWIAWFYVKSSTILQSSYIDSQSQQKSAEDISVDKKSAEEISLDKKIAEFNLYIEEDIKKHAKPTRTSFISVSTSTPSINSSYRCQKKYHCSQMRSCEEATYYIKNCPNTKMDGDRDGIPCERSLCGH